MVGSKGPDATRSAQPARGRLDRLELHESPSIGPRSKDTLANRMTVTVEPGLYYREMGGGVRLEDVVVIQNGRPKNLTKFEKVLEV